MRPAVAVAISFIDAINRRDLDALSSVMSDDHSLEVMAEPPLVGRDENEDAWDGYFASFPNYVIYPHRITEHDGAVAILGHTTGSHLDLPDEEESQLTLIWVAHVSDGLVTRWRLLEDTISRRREFAFSD